MCYHFCGSELDRSDQLPRLPERFQTLRDAAILRFSSHATRSSAGSSRNSALQISDFARPNPEGANLLCHHRRHVHHPIAFECVQDLIAIASFDASSVVEAQDYFDSGIRNPRKTTNSENTMTNGILRFNADSAEMSQKRNER